MGSGLNYFTMCALGALEKTQMLLVSQCSTATITTSFVCEIKDTSLTWTTAFSRAHWLGVDNISFDSSWDISIEESWGTHLEKAQQKLNHFKLISHARDNVQAMGAEVQCEQGDWRTKWAYLQLRFHWKHWIIKIPIEAQRFHQNFAFNCQTNVLYKWKKSGKHYSK